MMSSMEDECGYSDPLSSHHAQQAFYYNDNDMTIFILLSDTTNLEEILLLWIFDM